MRESNEAGSPRTTCVVLLLAFFLPASVAWAKSTKADGQKVTSQLVATSSGVRLAEVKSKADDRHDDSDDQDDHRGPRDALVYFAPPSLSPNPFDPARQVTTLGLKFAVKPLDGLNPQTKADDDRDDDHPGTRRQFLIRTAWRILTPPGIVIIQRDTPITQPVQIVRVPKTRGHGTRKAILVTADLSWNGRTASGACLPDADYSWTVEATLVRVTTGPRKTREKLIGQPVTSSGRVTIAGRPPTLVVTTPRDGFATNKTTVAISGAAQGQEPIQVLINGTPVAMSSGLFSVDRALDRDEVHVFEIVAIDCALRRSPTSTRRVFRDTAAPQMSLTAPSLTNEKTPSIVVTYSDTGTGVDTDALNISIQGEDRTSLFQIGPTSASLKSGVDLALPDEMIEIKASVLDRAGNSTTVSAKTVIDTTKPTLSLSFAPAYRGFTSSARPTVTATYQDGGSGVDLSDVVGTLDGGSITFTAGPSTATFTPTTDLSESPHEVQLAVKDKAGNSSGTVTLSFTPDLTSPLLALSPSSGKTVESDRPKLTATYGDPGTFASGIDQGSYQASLDNVSITTASTVGPIQATFTPVLPLSSGKHVFRAQVADNVGRTVTLESQFIVAPPVSVGDAGLAVGLVVDASSGAPISGATISTPALGITTSTSAQGMFVLRVPAGPTVIDVAQTGYEGPIQRFVNVVMDRETAVPTVALSKIDSQVTHIQSAAGGTATNSAGTIAIVFPSGSLPRDADLTITHLADPQALPPDPPRGTLPGQAFVVSPHGLTLTQPVTVTMANSLGLRPGHRLLLYAFNPDTGAWNIAGPGIVGPDGSSITGTTPHLTIFAFG